MTRYLRGRLERIREGIGPSGAPHNAEARERIREHLDAIAEARRSGNWTEEDAARLRGAVRAEAERRRGEGDTYWLNALE